MKIECQDKTTTQQLRIGGMTCVNCQRRIEGKLRSTAGVVQARVSYNAGTATVTYDAGQLTLRDITAIIGKLGYEAVTGTAPQKQTDTSRGIGAIIIIAAVYVLMERFGFTRLFTNFQLAEGGMGYGMLFVIGLVTSVHCAAMCGGINMSQCIPNASHNGSGGSFSALWPAFQYNLGRVISYTVVGGVVGLAGGVISLSGTFRGLVQVIAGVFMVIMGVNMLGFFPALRRFIPRMPRSFASKINGEKGRSKGPMYIGLLNGFMPCGPLQAMQIYALSTGDPIRGALSMLVFSLGTVPLMFGLGALSSLLSRRFTGRMMTAGAVLVAVLGLSMFSQGISLSGFSGLPVTIANGGAGNLSSQTEAVIKDGTQIVNTTLSPGRYPSITVQAGMPVKWTINAPEGSINGCNNRIFIPEYDIEYAFVPGENVIAFMPTKAGAFQYSCWMGMIRANIMVKEEK